MLCAPLFAAALIQLTLRTVLEAKAAELRACDELETMGASCELAPLLPAPLIAELEQIAPAETAACLYWTEAVHLHERETAEDAVDYLDDLPLLRYVWIDRARPSDLLALNALASVDQVRIDLPLLEDGFAEALRPFFHRPGLRQLKLYLEPAALGRAIIGDAEFAAAGASRALECLSLRRVRISPSQLRMIGRSKSLESLSLDSCGLGDAPLAALGGCTRLTFLRLVDDEMPDESLAGLSALRSLDTLEIAGARFSDGCVPHLAAMPWLESLQVSRAPAMTQNGCRVLSSLLPMTRVVNSEFRDVK